MMILRKKDSCEMNYQYEVLEILFIVLFIFALKWHMTKSLCQSDSKIILNFEFWILVFKEKIFQEQGHYKVFLPAAVIVKEIKKNIFQAEMQVIQDRMLVLEDRLKSKKKKKLWNTLLTF